MKLNEASLIVKLFIFFLGIEMLSCRQPEFIEKAAVTTGEIEEIEVRGAVASGNIIDLGQGISEYGHCWKAGKYPTIEDNKTTFGAISKKGRYNSDLVNLEPGVSYSVRSYIISGGQVIYGKEKLFNTPTGKSFLNTFSISRIAIYTAFAGGEITYDGGDSITSRGICWAVNNYPTIENNVLYSGGGIGSFSDTIRDLAENTKYFVRAFAKNSVGIEYGRYVFFTTENSLDFIRTFDATNISISGATVGGEIIRDIGENIITRGVCWNTTGMPTIMDNKTTNGSGIGIFSAEITGLTRANKYYVRSYATSSSGTIYGPPIQFTTQDGVGLVLTNDISDITISTALSGGNSVDDGGDTIIARGVCWNTTGSPLVTDNSTVDGSGIGTYVSKITGLLPNTMYFVRAYVTNSIETNYGEEVRFTTFNDSISDIEDNYYYTIQIGTQEWMAENLRSTKLNDGGQLIPSPASPAHWLALSDTTIYRWPNDNIAYKERYGALYNWKTVETGKLCPVGWHVPSNNEWEILTHYLGGASIAGGKLKTVGSIDWNNPNLGATNEVGFTALPAGYITSGGSPFSFKNTGIWWSTSSALPSMAWFRSVRYDNEVITKNYYSKKGGLSIRCVKD
jgi:uncharacterized protein (TIGR02145 family)